MIVPSMTVQEIHKEIFEDVQNLRMKANEFKDEFKKTVLHSKLYPLTKLFDYKTPKKRNLFVITFTARKRSDWKKPLLGIFGIYSRAEGMYGIAVTLDMNMTSIYPPHFFQRYRERILKDKSYSNENIIRHYFGNDWGFTGAVVNKEFASFYHSFENGDPNDKVSFVAATSQGYCFGERQGNVNIFKTIVSDEMLFDDQKFVFSELRKAFRLENKERFNVIL